MKHKTDIKIIEDENGNPISFEEVELPYSFVDDWYIDSQKTNLEEYLGKTKPLEWNYPGWLAYWRQVLKDNPKLDGFIYLDQEDFNSIVKQYRPPLLAASEPPKQEQGELSRGRKDEAEDLPSILERAKEAFKKKVEESEWYNTCPLIRKPFIWLGSIRELALALSVENGLLDSKENNRLEEVYIADVADCVFKKSTGEPITHEQLYNAAKQARDEDNKIKFIPPKKPRSK